MSTARRKSASEGGNLLTALQGKVESRRAKGLLRAVTTRGHGQVDFCSNDYLGLARSEALAASIDKAYNGFSRRHPCSSLGSTGSRLLTGNSSLAESLESYLAEFHGTERALLFNSGFDANLGLFASAPQPSDVVVFDELCHSSMREGMKLSRSRCVQFAHNDVEDLCRVLSEQRRSLPPGGGLIIAIESVYSMDGHCAPLKEMVELAERFGAALIVDEAHSTGVHGEGGAGLCAALGVSERVFCRIHTFGKGLGVHGAAIVGPDVLCTYLLNYARSLVYTTALPAHSLISVRCAYDFMRAEAPRRQHHLQTLVRRFRERSAALPADRTLLSDTPVQGVIVPGNVACVEAARALQPVSRHRATFEAPTFPPTVLNAYHMMYMGRYSCVHADTERDLILRDSGFDVKPIRSPTVPVGTERIRIILHFHNTLSEVEGLWDAIEATLGTRGGRLTTEAALGASPPQIVRQMGLRAVTLPAFEVESDWTSQCSELIVSPIHRGFNDTDYFLVS